MKEHIKDNLINFFIIVTMVNIVIFICGSLFAPDQNITYAAFIVPIIDGILGSIPGLIILLFSFGFSGFRIENLNMMAIVALSVAAVYISVWVIRFFLDSRKAKKMTDDLKMFQKSLSGKAN